MDPQIIQAAVVVLLIAGACAYGGLMVANWLAGPSTPRTPAPPATDTLAATPAPPAPKQLVKDSFDGDDPLEALLHTCNQFARDGRGDLAQRALQLRMEAARPPLVKHNPEFD